MSQKSDYLPMLCPPGNGVFTVNTAKERKASLHQRLFNESAPEKVESAWKNSLGDLGTKTKVALLGICSDCGGGIQRGANWGPLFIRQNTYENSPWYKKPEFLDL